MDTMYEETQEDVQERSVNHISRQGNLLLAITVKSRPRIRLFIQTPRRRTRIVHRRPPKVACILVLVATACRTVHNCCVVPAERHQYIREKDCRRWRTQLTI